MHEETNPYAPPRSEVGAPEPARAIVPAGKGRRLGTLLVDYAMFILFSFLIGIVVALLFGDAGIQAIQSVPDLVLGVLVLFTYYVFFEAIRTLCRFIPFEPFSCLGERGWHDSIPKTRVVLARAR